MALTTTWLRGEDLRVLDSIVAEMGWTPLPTAAVALVSFDEKGVAGFHILQVIPHAEPLYVRPDLRGSGLAADLAGQMSQFLKDTNTASFMVIADDPQAAKLCESLGMRRINSPVYVR